MKQNILSKNKFRDLNLEELTLHNNYTFQNLDLNKFNYSESELSKKINTNIEKVEKNLEELKKSLKTEYKESEIEWIGKIPKNWEITKIKYITHSLISGGTPLTSNKDYWDNEDIPWVTIADMSINPIINNTKKKISHKAVKEKGLKILKKGTLVYSIFATLGKVCELNIEATTNQAIVGIIENKNRVTKDFLKYFLIDFEKNISYLSSSNTQDNINTTKLENIKIPLPPLDKQSRIAKYLDEQLLKIDTLIHNTQLQIDKLQEYEKSLINKAVTKGLNENAEFIESGIEWIGTIPKNWEITKIKYVTHDLISGGTPLTSNKDYWDDEDIPWVTIADMSVNPIINNTKKKISHKAVKEKGLKILKKGTLVYSIFATLGKVCELNIDATTNQAIVGIIENKNRVTKDFLKYFLIDFEKNISYLSSSNTQDNINTTKLENIKIPLPALEEQEQIAQFLDQKTQTIRGIIANKEKQIELYKEYKTSLINDMVTGKRRI